MPSSLGGSMKKIKSYQIALCVFFVTFGGFVYWLNNEYLTPFKVVNDENVSYEKAKVIEVVDSYLEEDSDVESGYRGSQDLKLEIQTGTYKGTIVESTNYLTRTHNVYAVKNQKLIVSIDQRSIENHVAVYSYSRSSIIYLMIFMFLALMVMVGDFKGLKSAIGLIFTLGCILFFTLPLIFNGYSPIVISILSTMLITAVTLIMIDGLSKKVLIASISTACGVILAGVIFTLFGKALHISGYNMEDAEALIVVSQNTGLQIKNILFASVLIGSIGAVLDVAMSIASSLSEVYEHNHQLTTKELFSSGVNIGKDMIGTMSSTLILAYVGGSFATLLLFYGYGTNYYQLINMDYLVLEISQALAGSMGIILTVPIASYIGAKVLSRTDIKKE